MKKVGLLLALISIGFNACRESKPASKATVEKPAAYELESLAVNGDTLHYLDVGKGEPIIFVHGSIGDYRAWETQIDTFATKYRVIAYSMRYAWPNATPLSDTLDYSAGQHAKDLAQLIKTLNLGQAHLVGHSYGGYTVLKTAIDNPELVKSMVLGEPPAAPLIAGSKEGDSLLNDFQNNVLKPAGEFFSEQQKDSAVATFVAGVMGSKEVYGAVPREVRKRWLMNTTESEGGLITDSWTPVSSNEVKQLQIPTLLVTGEFSPRFFGKIIDTLVTLLPKNELKLLPKASHGLQTENPKEFNTMVLNFLDKN
jgi:pimeloyl-ACP methyl ester carboxylesterase